MKRYHYFYKITNTETGQYYFGIHSTDNLDDNYFGSGTRLKTAIKMFGKDSFEKEIVKFFNTRNEASEYEASMVTESVVADENSYNLKLGGDFGLTCGTILVKDKSHKYQRVKPNDERYISGELVPFSSGEIVVFDKEENEYKLIAYDSFNKNRERYKLPTEGHLVAKDKNGNIFYISIDDERYKNGVLKPLWSGRKHSVKTREKMSSSHKVNGDQKGVKNSQYGTCWVTDGVNNLKIKKEDWEKYSKNGWTKGRKIKEENIKRKTDFISKEEVLKLRKSGLTWKDIAKYFGVGKHAMTDYRKRNNIGE